MTHLEMLTAKWLRSEIQRLQDLQGKQWTSERADEISKLKNELKKATEYK